MSPDGTGDHDVPVFGQLSVHPPAIGPFIMAADGLVLDIRLGFEPGLGEPLLAGVLPASCLGQPDGVDSACLCLWPSPADLADNRVAVFQLDLSVFPADDPLLAFVLHGQPPGFEPLIGTRLAWGARLSMDRQPLQDVARRWWQANGTPEPTPGMIAALVHAQRQAFERVRSPRELACLSRPFPWRTPQHSGSSHRRVCFAVSCCHYPAGMFDRTPQSQAASAPSPSDRSLVAWDWQRRQRRAGRECGPEPEFVLMLGDQIYVDATAGVFDPALSDDRYTAPYRQWLTNAVVQRACAGLLLHAMPDDHELLDNWAPVDPQSRAIDAVGQPASAPDHIARIRHEGLLAYWTYQGHRQTGSLYRLAGPPDLPGLVFMADTRTERTRRRADQLDQARLISDEQWAALRQWLSESQGAGPRFLACPAMVLPRHRVACGPTPASALRSDAWDGYPASLLALLTLIAELRLNQLVLLSGDEHLASVSQIRLLDRGTGDAPPVETVLHAIHAPALYAPYPFANARPDDFNLAAFGFEPGGTACLPPDPTDGPPPRYRCEVHTWFPSRANGFLWIDTPTAEQPAQRLRLRLSFPEAHEVTPVPAWLADSRTLEIEVVTGNPQPAGTA